MFTPRQISNFWAKVSIGSKDECWPWLGAKTNKGYGSFRVSQKTMLATHVALILADRPRPSSPNNHALHGDTCAAPSCCNPGHLRWGSNAENMADMVRLGRQMRGAGHSKAKLSEEQAAFIRASTLPQSVLMEMFSISSPQVSGIRRGTKWAGLGGEAVRANAKDRGETHSRAKLSEIQARAIKGSDEPSSVLASRYGVHARHVWQIRTGRKWSHLGEPG